MSLIDRLLINTSNDSMNLGSKVVEVFTHKIAARGSKEKASLCARHTCFFASGKSSTGL